MDKMDIPKANKSCDSNAASSLCVVEAKLAELMSQMTLTEKIGQLNQVNADGHEVSDALRADLKEGRIGSVLNQVDPDIIEEIQRISVEESRLGIPLLIGRDVIHGFNHISPIPLGQAATFNPELVEDCARLSALEARNVGVNWAFSPMIDVSRDARWGRIAESFGEDPLLNSTLGVAMIKGFQGEELSPNSLMAACAKHFVGYGASEGGRDYNTTNIPENELRNIYLRPFKAAIEADVASLMTSFSDLDGVPATANDFILRDILRDQWEYEGLVLSDWAAISQLITHGIAKDNKEAAALAIKAGVDMDMESHAYITHLEVLISDGIVDMATLNACVANVLRLKFKLGLFEAETVTIETETQETTKKTLKDAATQSMVLLKNDRNLLPLNPDKLSRLSLLGPLIDSPYEQLGTWIFDGNPELSVTPLQAVQSSYKKDIIIHANVAMDTTRSKDTRGFAALAQEAKASDAIILCLGEEAILSGEAHSRADIRLPGAQESLIEELHKTGRPIIAVFMAGRPIVVSQILDKVDALIYAWHPGTMGGEALMDLIMGQAVPSGKLPVSIPKSVGQIPIYYNHKNTGRPADPNRILHIDDIDTGASQTSFGMTSFYLDDGYKPQFPFGFGLSYTQFSYDDLRLSSDVIGLNEALKVSVRLANRGPIAGTEVVQLYIRDVVGSVTRPVKELKDFCRVYLEPGQSKIVDFEVGAEDLAFYRRNRSFGAEAGQFHLWVGGSSVATLMGEFELKL